jgi:hypothetical protein
VDDDVRELRIVGEALLDEAGERREHERLIDPELVHELDTRHGLEERRQRPHGLHDLLARLTGRRTRLEVVLLRAGGTHDLERRVRDVVGDRATHHQLGAALVVDVLDRVLVPIR